MCSFRPTLLPPLLLYVNCNTQMSADLSTTGDLVFSMSLKTIDVQIKQKYQLMWKVAHSSFLSILSIFEQPIDVCGRDVMYLTGP